MTTNQIPLVDYLVLDDPPHLRSYVCNKCGALYFDRRNACAKCGADEFGTRALSNDGVVRAFTVVYRAAPSVPAPYMSVIVDLDGGGTVKANMLDAPKPEQITPGLRVQLSTFVAGTDDFGTEAVAFGYRPTIKIEAITHG